MGSSKRKRRSKESVVEAKRAQVEQTAPDTMAKFQQLVSDADAATMQAMIEKLQQALKERGPSTQSTIFVAATNDTVDVETENDDNDPLESADDNDEHDDNDEEDGTDDDECASDSGIDVDATTTAVRAKCAKGAGGNDGKVVKHSNARPDWFPVTSFTNAAEYDAYIKRENFSVHKTVTTKKVINRYMRCKLVKKNGPQCRTRLCVRISKQEFSWVVLTNGHDHTHGLIKNKLPAAKRGKPVEIKQERNLSPIAPPIGTQALVGRVPDSNPVFEVAPMEQFDSRSGTLSVVRKTHVNYVPF